MRKLVFMSIFSATAVALGLLLLSIPNVELVTTTFFLAGYFLGVRDGIISAVVGEFVYSMLNPMGSAAPPLLVAQIVGMAAMAIAGGIVANKHRFFFSAINPNQEAQRKETPITSPSTRLNNSKAIHKKQFIYFGLLGFMLTLFFDILTTISFLLFAGLTVTSFLISTIYGLYFYLIHIGINTLIFAFIVPILIPTINNRLPVQMNRWNR